MSERPLVQYAPEAKKKATDNGGKSFSEWSTLLRKQSFWKKTQEAPCEVFLKGQGANLRVTIGILPNVKSVTPKKAVVLEKPKKRWGNQPVAQWW